MGAPQPCRGPVSGEATDQLGSSGHAYLIGIGSLRPGIAHMLHVRSWAAGKEALQMKSVPH